MAGALPLRSSSRSPTRSSCSATVAVAGLILGSIKYRGIKLGTAGIIFAGIVIGHFGERVDHATLDFVKEFGLVLFVFTIGMQLGPGFLAALREQGLRLNLLAAAIVACGAGIAVAGAMLLRIDSAAAVGLLAGATTNTPSLGAAQQAIATLPGVAGRSRGPAGAGVRRRISGRASVASSARSWRCGGSSALTRRGGGGVQGRAAPERSSRWSGPTSSSKTPGWTTCRSNRSPAVTRRAWSSPASGPAGTARPTSRPDGRRAQGRRAPRRRHESRAGAVRTDRRPHVRPGPDQVGRPRHLTPGRRHAQGGARQEPAGAGAGLAARRTPSPASSAATWR